MKEAWKGVSGYPIYFVSDKGRVKRITKTKRGFHHGNEYFYRSKGRIIKQTKIRSGKHLTYLQVGLWKDGRQKSDNVHRLVAKAFLKNENNKPQVNHKDGDGTNNNKNNLEWVTGSENSLHAYRVLGREAWSKGVFGEKAPTSRPLIQKTKDGKIIKRWGCGLDAVRQGGFDSSCISRCASGKAGHHRGYIWEYE